MTNQIPNDVLENERVLIGQLMLGTEHARRIVEFLPASDMQDSRHQVVYGTVASMCRHQEPMDVAAVERALLGSGELARAGGAGYLRSLVTAAQSCPPGRLLALAGVIAARAVDPTIPSLSSPANAAPTRSVNDQPTMHPAVYLSVDEGGIGWAGLDRSRAHEHARNTGSVVVALPVIADYRSPEQQVLPVERIEPPRFDCLTCWDRPKPGHYCANCGRQG